MAPEERTERGLEFANEALDNWGPRFVSYGVNRKDLDRIRSSMSAWNEWCEAFSDVGAEHAKLGETALERGSTESVAHHYTQAAMYYHYGSFVWHEDDEERDEAHRTAVDLFSRGGEYLDPPVQRIEAPTGRGFDIPGLLRVPEKSPEGERGPSPLVLIHPGLDSVKEELSLALGEYYLDRGMATLFLDGPGQGESWYNHRMTPDYHEFISPVVDHVEELAPEGVDPSRLGIMGVSLGGFYAPLVAANDDRFDACIGLSGRFTVGPVGDSTSDLHKEQFMWACQTDSMDEVDEITRAMTLEDCIDDLTCPSLMLTGSEDTIVLPEATREIAERAPNAEYLEVDGANHCCSDMPYKSYPYMVDWLRRQIA